MINKKYIYLILFATVLILLGLYNYYKLSKEPKESYINKKKIKISSSNSIKMPLIKKQAVLNKIIKKEEIDNKPDINVKQTNDKNDKDDLSFDLDDLESLDKKAYEINGDDFSLSLLDMDNNDKPDNESLPESLESF
jgi:maltose-binding protein MalE